MTGLFACHNLLFAGKDELAGGVFTNGSGIPIIFCALTPALSQAPALASALSLPSRYIDKDLRKITKLALELFV